MTIALLLLASFVGVGFSAYRLGKQHEYQRLQPYIAGLSQRLDNCKRVIAGFETRKVTPLKVVTRASK